MERIGKTVLKKFLKIEKNISILEKSIYEQCKDEDDYKIILFDVIEYIRQGKTLSFILGEIKSQKMGWNHPHFHNIKVEQEEQDGFILKPFEVEEGVLKCGKCNQSKTFSYSKQTRGADEPMTTFATCMNCKHKWTYSG